ncbi:MAG TPA: nucleotidyltransferase family protein [Gemmatimonadales bacterium]
MTASHLERKPIRSHSVPAAEALLELVRHDAVARPSGRLSELLAGEEARSALQVLAARHGVLGVVLAGLGAAAPGDPVLASRCATLLAQRPAIRKQAVMWDLETDRLLRLLDDAGLRPVTLKGAALRVSAYHDSAQRSFGDVDLLLPASDIERAIASLEAAGYALGDAATVARFEQLHFHHQLTNAMGFQVELHWDLTQPDAAIRLLPERFMARSRTLERPGAPPIRIPSPEDMVLHLASQEVEDWFSTIRRLVDIDRVVRSEAAFDWSYLRSAAAEARMSQLLGFTLQLTRRLLSTPMPDGFVQSLELSRAARFHLALLDPVTSVLTSYSRRRVTASRFMAIWLCPDSRTRWGTIREIATDQFDSFGAAVVEGAPPAPLRGMVGLAKLGSLWGGLYLRRGVAVALQSALGHRDFWGGSA